MSEEKVLRDAVAVRKAAGFCQEEITRRTKRLDDLEREISELSQEAKIEREKISEMEEIRNKLQGF